MSTPLIAVCGPTGAGKSALAIHLARQFSGEVINCDSLQVYRHFDIGTAKLREGERGGIRHHLIDVADAHESFTAGDWALQARAVLSAISGRGNLPIIAGGTGFYLRALLGGLSPGPDSDPAFRRRLRERERRRPGSLHRILRRVDPEAADRIHARDAARTIRALEIRARAGHRASAQPPREPLAGYRICKIGLFPPRELLYAQLNERCERMLAGGLIGEIEQLLERGTPRDVKPFQSLGYKEGLAIIEKRMAFDDALEQMRRETRHYAKRQMTWFRHEPGIVALNGFGDVAAVEEEARQLVRALIDSE